MSIVIPGRVVVFDYGEVISTSPTAEHREAIVGIAAPADPAAFWSSYDRHRDALDKGELRVRDYWMRIAAGTGASYSESDIQRLWAVDFRAWISVEPGTIDIITELHEGGTRLAILSNAGFDFASPLRFSPMGRYFERVFVSAEMDMVKPDPAIYLAAARELGITPAGMVFIDNKQVNTDAAAALGITAHHFTGVEGLRAFLTSLADSDG